MTRRQALALIGAAANLPAAKAPPPLCLFSAAVARLEYSDIGAILKQIGFDGVDLTVRPGGHVEPRLSNVDLVRAIEDMHGPGLDVPVITTALTSPFDPTVLPVIAIAGRTKVPRFIPGFWRADALTVRRDLSGLVSIGARYGMAIALHNHTAENAGEASWDVKETLDQLDPHWAGIYFDPCHHGENWEAELKRSLPRLSVVALKDFQVANAKATVCPLGEGVMDWPKFFSILAGAGFDGPLSLRIEYRPKDELAAINKDYEFARKHLTAGYAAGAAAHS